MPTGEVFFISQALGFRHSHLDAGGYSYDQKQKGKDVAQAVDFLVQDEKARVLLTSMVSCLFAREVYKESVLADCLNAVGYRNLAENLDSVARRIQKMRWQIRMKTGYDPASVTIPKRFTAGGHLARVPWIRITWILCKRPMPKRSGRWGKRRGRRMLSWSKGFLEYRSDGGMECCC